MMPVDFVFYRNEYGGALIPDAASFKRMIRKADGYLKEAIHQNPSETHQEQVWLCLCEVAEILYQEEQRKQQSGGQEIQSENTDGYSVTYVSETGSLHREISGVIRRYLAHSGLLYAGVRCHANKCNDNYF